MERTSADDTATTAGFEYGSSLFDLTEIYVTISLERVLKHAVQLGYPARIRQYLCWVRRDMLAKRKARNRCTQGSALFAGTCESLAAILGQTPHLTFENLPENTKQELLGDACVRRRATAPGPHRGTSAARPREGTSRTSQRTRSRICWRS